MKIFFLSRSPTIFSPLSSFSYYFTSSNLIYINTTKSYALLFIRHHDLVYDHTYCTHIYEFYDCRDTDCSLQNLLAFKNRIQTSHVVHCLSQRDGVVNNVDKIYYILHISRISLGEVGGGEMAKQILLLHSKYIEINSWVISIYNRYTNH